MQIILQCKSGFEDGANEIQQSTIEDRYLSRQTTVIIYKHCNRDYESFALLYYRQGLVLAQ